MTKIFGRPISATKKFPYHQQSFDGEVAVRKGATTFCALVFMEPVLDDVVADPQCELASFDESFVIFLPVDDFSRLCSPCNDLSCFGQAFFVLLFLPVLLLLLFSTVFVVCVMI